MPNSKENDIIYGESLEEIFPCIESYKEICLFVDSNLRYGLASGLISRLDDEGRLKCLYLFEASENNKTLSSVESAVSDMIEAGINRNALVLAVGGGITTDVAGFTASVYKRGLRFAFVPTTLLSQADAAVGGKNGVNFDGYKNMIGVIRQPEFTFICPSALKTLPRRQILSGAAEMLKTFIIADAGAYEETIKLLCEFRRCRDDAGTDDCPGDYAGYGQFLSRLSGLAAKAARIKTDIVSRDPYEDGIRRVLNLGHTFAHAAEALAVRQGVDLTHGEAVAAGMICAAGLSSDKSLAGRLKADFVSVGLPFTMPFAMADMAALMNKDKKAESGSVHFVIPEAVGRCIIREMSVDEAIAALTTDDL